MCTVAVAVLFGMMSKASPVSQLSEPKIVLDLPVREGVTRNSEGDFLRLKDGRILFVYSRFTKNMGRGMTDHDPADMAARYSSDEGCTWTTEDRIVIRQPTNTWNVMSADLKRLPDGRIALFYCMKRFKGDCRPYVAFSKDEGETWTEGKCLFPDDMGGYYAMKNHAVCLTSKGRLVVPIYGGRIFCMLSDDLGKTWRYSQSFKAKDSRGKYAPLDESQVVELANGSLVIFCRSYSDWQWWAYSFDGGETWGPAVPCGLVSPGSPLSIVKLENKDWLVAWNDLYGRPQMFNIKNVCNGMRSPIVLAVSKDEGRTWIHRRALEGNTHPWGRWYDYPSLFETQDGCVLVHYCYEGRRKKGGLSESHIVKVPLKWVYEAPVWDDKYETKGVLDALQ